MQVGKNTIIYHQDKSVIFGDVQIGDNCKIHAPVWIADVVIGSNCKIQAFAFIPKGVTIGNNVFIGPHVCFTNDKHPPSQGMEWSETVVEDGVIIGANATILPGITLGKECIIGAGAVVTKSVPPNEIWVGNPARKPFGSKDRDDYPAIDEKQPYLFDSVGDADERNFHQPGCSFT